MAVFRVQKNQNYTVMSNHHLRNNTLSLKAKGLLSLMLSLPEEWDYTTRGLAKICKEGLDSICTTVKELEIHGYLIRIRCRNEKGQLTSIEYIIRENPEEITSNQPKDIFTESEPTSIPEQQSAEEKTLSLHSDPKIDQPAKTLENPEFSPKPENPVLVHQKKKSSGEKRKNPHTPTPKKPKREKPILDNPMQINKDRLSKDINIISKKKEKKYINYNIYNSGSENSDDSERKIDNSS